MPFLRRLKFTPQKNRMKTSVHPSSQCLIKYQYVRQITFGQTSPIYSLPFGSFILTGPQLNFSLDTFAAFAYSLVIWKIVATEIKGDSKSGPERMLIRCSSLLKGFRHT